MKSFSQVICLVAYKLRDGRLNKISPPERIFPILNNTLTIYTLDLLNYQTSDVEGKLSNKLVHHGL